MAPGSAVERLGDARVDGRPIGRDRARLGGTQPVARGRGVERADLRRCGFSAVKARTTGTLVRFGIGDQALGGGDARSQSARARPAIVDDQRQRVAAGRQRVRAD